MGRKIGYTKRRKNKVSKRRNTNRKNKVSKRKNKVSKRRNRKLKGGAGIFNRLKPKSKSKRLADLNDKIRKQMFADLRSDKTSFDNLNGSIDAWRRIKLMKRVADMEEMETEEKETEKENIKLIEGNIDWLRSNGILKMNWRETSIDDQVLFHFIKNGSTEQLRDLSKAINDISREVHGKILLRDTLLPDGMTSAVPGALKALLRAQAELDAGAKAEQAAAAAVEPAKALAEEAQAAAEAAEAAVAELAEDTEEEEVAPVKAAAEAAAKAAARAASDVVFLEARAAGKILPIFNISEIEEELNSMI